MEDLDVWRAAKVLIDLHGDNAVIEAARRIGGLQASGNAEGAAIWGRIHSAIVNLQAPPAQDEKLN